MPDANDPNGSHAGNDGRADRPTERFALRFVHQHVSYDSTLAEKDPEWVTARARREQRYQRFWDRQTNLGTRSYVALARMAESYAEDRLRSYPVGPKSEEERAELLEKYRIEAYQHLARDILGRRRFVRAGRSQVLYLNPYGPPRRLTAEALQQYRSVLPDSAVWAGVLSQCFVPPAGAREWMEAHGLNTRVLWPEETTIWGCKPEPQKIPPTANGFRRQYRDSSKT